jgi:hypothetical protein
MKQTLLLTLIVFSVVLISSCEKEDLVLTPPGYAYLTTDAFSIDTSTWGPNNIWFTYTLRLRNIGSKEAKFIMTQLEMKDTSGTRFTRLFRWWNIDTVAGDTTWDVIQPGGTGERTFTDSLTFRGPSIPPVNWRPSYLANPYNNEY